jgi:hypothetical protein
MGLCLVTQAIHKVQDSNYYKAALFIFIPDNHVISHTNVKFAHEGGDTAKALAPLGQGTSRPPRGHSLALPSVL